MKMLKEKENKYDLTMMVLFAFVSALLNTYLAIKTFTGYFGIPGPAAGMALLGGFIYGIVSPIWFGVYGIIALLLMGFFVDLTWSESKFRVGLGGGLGNLACLEVTWIASGFQRHFCK